MADEYECRSTSGTIMAWEDQVLAKNASRFRFCSNKQETIGKSKTTKFTLEQATKGQRSRGIAVLFL
jgi:hypothetical protein